MEALDNSQCEFNVGEALKKPLNADQLFIISHLIWSILDIFCDQNIIHGDLHWNNFYIDLRPNNEWNMDAHLSIIDFSWATIGPCRRELELLQLMRSLMFPHYDPTNREILTFYLVELFNHYTGRKETLSAQEIVCMYKSELDKYIRSK